NAGGWDVGSPRGGYFSPWENPNLPNEMDGENLSMRLARETTRFIEEHQTGPFLAYLSFYAVHGPIQTTREKWRKSRVKAEQLGIAGPGPESERRLRRLIQQHIPVYARLVEQMDAAVELLLAKVTGHDLDQNPRIILSADNRGVGSGD